MHFTRVNQAQSVCISVVASRFSLPSPCVALPQIQPTTVPTTKQALPTSTELKSVLLNDCCHRCSSCCFLLMSFSCILSNPSVYFTTMMSSFFCLCVVVVTILSSPSTSWMLLLKSTGLSWLIPCKSLAWSVATRVSNKILAVPASSSCLNNVISSQVTGNVKITCTNPSSMFSLNKYIARPVDARPISSQRSPLSKLSSASKKKIAMAKKDFLAISNVWRRSSLTWRRKLIIFGHLIESKLLYGLSSICLTVAQERKLNGFQNRCLRQIIGVKPAYISRVSNAEVLQKSGHTLATQLLRQHQI